ncbi:MAG: hypothetical protein HS115_12685 [Spirochaetales bacterium]|nr:hypothetical protein [Spirochaetales bacterium]
MAASKKKNAEQWILSIIALTLVFSGLYLRMDHWSLPYRFLFLLFPFFINTVLIFGIWPYLLNLPAVRLRFLLVISLPGAALLLLFFPAGTLPFLMALLILPLLLLLFFFAPRYVFRAVATGTISLLFIYGSFLLMHLQERLYWVAFREEPSVALYWTFSGQEIRLYHQKELLLRFEKSDDFFFHDDLKSPSGWLAGPQVRLGRLSASASDPTVPPVFTLGCGDFHADAWNRLLRHKEHSGFLRNLERAADITVPGFQTVGRFFYQDLATTQSMQLLILGRPGQGCNLVLGIEERRLRTADLSSAARAWLGSILDR